MKQKITILLCPILLFGMFLLYSANTVHANSTGKFSASGAYGYDSGDVPPILTLLGPSELVTGEVGVYTLTIQSTNKTIQTHAVHNIAIMDSDNNAADIIALSDTASQTSAAYSPEATYTEPKANNAAGVTQFSFEWTAPPMIGTYTIFYAGSSVDFSFPTLGDGVMNGSSVIEVINPIMNHDIATSTLPPTPTSPVLTPGDSFEVNNVCEDAGAIATNGTIQTHTFHDERDTDWVKFDVVTGANYIIEGQIPVTSTVDLAVELHNACNSLPSESQAYSFAPNINIQFTATQNETIYLHLNNNSESSGDDERYILSVRQLTNTPTTGAVIIVGGKLNDKDLVQRNINNMTNEAFNLFLRHGYSKDAIYYLSPDISLDADGDSVSDVTASSTVANLQTVIETSVLDQVDADRALTIYLMSHGHRDQFYLNYPLNEILYVEQLDEWLDTLEAARPGLKVNIIVEMCHAGSFINLTDSVSKEGRVIITSTGSENLAWSSAEGAQFSDSLLASLDQRSTLFNAFQQAKWHMLAEGGWQTPWIDDNGDGVPNTAEDGQVAALRGFGFSGTFSDNTTWIPYIAEATPFRVEEVGGQGTIEAVVEDDTRVNRVWAVIYPPSYTPPDPESDEFVSERANAGLTTVVLLDNGNDTYAVNHDFDEAGLYKVVIYAEDNETLMARPVSLDVYVGSVSSISLSTADASTTVPHLLIAFLTLCIATGLTKKDVATLSNPQQLA